MELVESSIQELASLTGPERDHRRTMRMTGPYTLLFCFLVYISGVSSETEV